MSSCSTEKENNDLGICIDLALESMQGSTYKIFINNGKDRFQDIITLQDSLRGNLKKLNIDGANEDLSDFFESESIEKMKKRMRFRKEEFNTIVGKVEMLYSNDFSKIERVNLIREIYNSIVFSINFGCGSRDVNIDLVYGDTLYLKPNRNYKIPYNIYSNGNPSMCFGDVDENEYFSLITPNYTEGIILRKMRKRIKNELTGERYSVQKIFYIKLEK